MTSDDAVRSTEQRTGARALRDYLCAQAVTPAMADLHAAMSDLEGSHHDATLTTT